MNDDLDLRPRLERLADELTRGTVTPPSAVAWRRGRRRRRRQLVGAGLLTITLAAIVAWPGAGLLDRGRSTVAPALPAAPVPTPSRRPLRPPRAAPGQSAVVIQDPPLGLPGKLHTWVSECKQVRFGHGGHEFEVPSFTIKRGSRRISWYVYPLGPVGSQRYKGPWANIQIWTDDPGNQKDPATFPFVEVYGPRVEVHLSRQNGRKGTIVGPYSVVQQVATPQGTGYRTLAGPTGAQVAIAWNCDAPPGTVPA